MDKSEIYFRSEVNMQLREKFIDFWVLGETREDWTINAFCGGESPTGLRYVVFEML